MGLAVILLEKSHFPRQKVCAGLLTWKTIDLVNKLFGLSIEALKSRGIVHHSCRDYDIYFKNRIIANGKLDYPFHFVKRTVYDHCFLQLARQSGVEVRTGEGLVSMDLNRVSVATSNGSRIKARVIIGADGVWSTVRKAMFPDSNARRHWRYQLASTLETRLHANRTCSCPPRAALHFGHVSWGYMWQFPGRGHMTLGVGALRRKNDKGLKSAFHRFVSVTNPNLLDTPCFISHPLPYGNYISKPSRGRALLVGDACGLADPLLGEGIYYAHRSGQLAALAVKDCLPGLDGLDRRYRRLMKMTIFKELRWIKFYRNLLFWGGPRRRFRGLKLFMRLFPKNLEAAVHGRYSFSQIFKPGNKPLYE